MDNRFLFLSVFSFAAGIALYFVLPVEPVIKFPILICALLLLCFLKYRAAVFIFAFGFFYASVRANFVDTDLLRHNRRNADIAGTVLDVDYAAEKNRVFVKTPDGLTLRLSVPFDCSVGSEISARANLYAPASVDAFNNFDYRRWSFFNGLSGSGSAISGTCHGGHQTFRGYLHAMAGNKLADALVLGYKNAIPRDDYDRIKTAGIAHIFSISGYHLALVGGWLFLIFYFLVRLFPKWTRRYPAKYLALPMVAVGLAVYLFLSGAAVATIRSFIMAAVGFIAVLANRKVLTIRNAAMVFGLMIAIKPFWLVSAGFQLSFAAIFGLLYFFENHPARGGRIQRFLYLLAMSSVVATIWTFPFIAYHFGNFPVYGLIGNLVLLPIFSILVMPIVMIGTVGAMFGWVFPFQISDYLYDIMMVFMDWLSRLPFSTVEFPDIGPICLFAVFAGMFALISGRKKVAHAIFATAIIFAVFRPAPVLRTTADGEVVGFTQNGRTYFNTRYSEKHPFIIPRKNKLRANCKKGLCIYKTNNWQAVSVQRFIPLYRNLAAFCDYDFIISYLPLELPACQSKVITNSVRIYSDRSVETANAERLWNKP